ncbi:MAG: hypothetical protein JNM99_25085 [Verrucomicrobiaceae bacterium]|nr:hypothetical protein [Verrucomicrobiaceae bacterium]
MTGMNMMNGGYAMIVLCGFGVMSAVITALMYGARGRRVEALLAHGGDFIAEWQVPQSMWQEIMRKQFEEERGYKQMLLKIVWFFCILFAVGFPLYDPEDGWWVTVVMVVMMAITGLLAVIMPRRRFQRLCATDAWVRVGRKCVMLGDELHAWTIPGSWLSAVNLCEEDGLNWLQVHYSFITRAGIQDETVFLPVPESARAMAENAAVSLQTIIKPGQEKRWSM